MPPTITPSGLSAALAGGHELVVLDVMLPGGSGFELLKALRRQSQVPVLLLTARGEAVDRIVGLEIGADDYLAKPFDPARTGRANPRHLPPHPRAGAVRGASGAG